MLPSPHIRQLLLAVGTIAYIVPTGMSVGTSIVPADSATAAVGSHAEGSSPPQGQRLPQHTAAGAEIMTRVAGECNNLSGNSRNASLTFILPTSSCSDQNWLCHMLLLYLFTRLKKLVEAMRIDKGVVCNAMDV